MGVDKMSGCELADLLENRIGIKQIVSVIGSGSILEHISHEAMLDYLINESSIEVSVFIKPLLYSEIENMGSEELGIQALFRRMDFLVDMNEALSDNEKIEILTGARTLKRAIGL